MIIVRLENYIVQDLTRLDDLRFCNVAVNRRVLLIQRRELNELNVSP